MSWLEREKMGWASVRNGDTVRPGKERSVGRLRRLVRWCCYLLFGVGVDGGFYEQTNGIGL